MEDLSEDFGEQQPTKVPYRGEQPQALPPGAPQAPPPIPQRVERQVPEQQEQIYPEAPAKKPKTFDLSFTLDELETVLIAIQQSEEFKVAQLIGYKQNRMVKIFNAIFPFWEKQKNRQ